MKLATVRRFALALPEVTEAPHHHYGSFRVRGKLFVTFPPDGEFLHLFVSEEGRERALELYPEHVGKLLWGGKVAGIRVTLKTAAPRVVKELVRSAWEHKAPKSLLA
jgi:hypothetical protein